MISIQFFFKKKLPGNHEIESMMQSNTELMTTQVKGTIQSFIAHEGTTRNLIPYLVEKAQIFLQGHSYMFLISAEGRTVGNVYFPDLNNHEEADTFLVYHAIHAVEIVKITYVFILQIQMSWLLPVRT